MDRYFIEIDLDAPEPTPEQLDILMEALDAFDCSWGTGYGRLQASLIVPGKSLRQALVVGIALVEDAATQAGFDGPKLLEVAAASAAVNAAGLLPVRMPVLMSTEEVASRLGISRQAVHQRAAALGGVKVGTANVFCAMQINHLAARRAAR